MMTFGGELFQRAFQAHKIGHLGEAEAGYREVLADEPDHPSALHLLGLIAFDTGEVETAIPLVERSIELAPEEFQWVLNYGKILSKAGRNEGAMSAYKKALTMNPRSLEAGMALGDLFVAAGNLTEASKVYYAMLCDAPHDRTLRVKYGEILQGLGKSEVAHDFIFGRALQSFGPPTREEGSPSAPEMTKSTVVRGGSFPAGKLDPIAECAIMADASFRLGYRESASFYVVAGLNEMLRGRKPVASLRELLKAWDVTTAGGLFARLWTEFMAHSMFYATFDHVKQILDYWAAQEPKNPEPFIRLGLVMALAASQNGSPAPKEAIDKVRYAHKLLNNARTAAALELLEAKVALPALAVPYDGGNLFVYPNIGNTTTFVLLEKGEWIEDDITLFRALLRPGDTVLDLGANVGVYSISAARRVGENGRVVSVEPCKTTFSLLRRSAKAFNNMTTIRAAVAEVISRGILEADSSPELMRLTSDSGGIGEEVEITTVDELAKREGISHFDIIKMDVEGVEEKVIAGAKRLLSHTDPIVFYEVSESGLGLAKLFESFGYESYYYWAPRKAIVRYHVGEKLNDFKMNLIAIRPAVMSRFEGIASIE